MEKLSDRVKELRNRKGMSQEVLAEESGLSLRTIQRIENNENIPRGDSLIKLANALNTTPDELVDWKIHEDRNYLIIMSLSSLGFLFFPILGIIIPLILWISKKDKTQGVNELGKSIINFQITWSLLVFSYYLLLTTGLWGKFMMLIYQGQASSVFLKILIPIAVLYLYNVIITLVNTILISSNKNTKYIPALRILR